MKKWFVILSVFLFCFLVATNCKVKRVEEVTDAEKVSYEYAISKENPFHYVTLEEAVALLDQSGILYIGYPENNASHYLVSALTEIGEETDLSISYFNPQGEEEEELYATLLEKLQVKELMVPAIYFIKDGEIILKDTSLAKEAPDYYTKEEQEKLKEKYEQFVQDYQEKMAS